MVKLFDAPKVNIKSNLLIDKFVVPPLTILNSQQGYWQTRKRHWTALGIKSEVGRDGDLLGKGISTIKGRSGEPASKLPGTSIFDPVLCECLYTWFSREGDTIFDPFAGGSVRGIVAGALQRNYTGIDLREEQIDANNTNYDEIAEHYTGIIKPNWVVGNSLDCKKLVGGDKKFDMLMTCPPYYDLEVYSDKPDDLSNLDDYEDFLTMYRQIFKEAYDLMNDDTFAVVVVSEIRDKKTGNYRGFVPDTIKIMEEAGFHYYNEAILLGAYTTVTLRAPKQFNIGRKLGRCHQNVLIFYKGDNSHIRDKFGEVDVDCNEQFMD